MGTTTTTFALNKPTVGGDDNAWGTDWNTNADKLDDLLDGTTAIKPNLTEGQWKVGGVAVTSSAAELNVLDGIPGTLTVTELGYVDGVTSAIQTQLDGKQALDADLTAIAGISSNGLVARTGAGTASARTITGGTFVSVTNGDGVSGNPTLDLSAAAVVTASETIASNNNDTTLPTSAAVDTQISARKNIIWQTPISASSGTAIDFTGWPVGVREVYIAFEGVSLSGTDSVLIQMIVSGSPVTSGYISSNSNSGSTSGFIMPGNLAANAIYGVADFFLYDDTNFKWVGGSRVRTSSGSALGSGGWVDLAGAVTGVRITRTGTDTFDGAGSLVTAGYRL